MEKTPQLENGYCKIANGILDAMCRYRIPGEQMQILLHIIRQTYGWNRKEAEISVAQFAQATDIKAPNVCRALKSLENKNVITIIKNDNRSNPTYRFNKYFNQWQALSKKITSKSIIKNDNESLSKKIMNVIKNDNNSTILPITSKDILKTYKDKNVATPKKRVATPAFQYDSIPYFLSETLFNQIILNLPDFGPSRNGHREKTIQRWAVDIDKMIRIDKRKPCHIWNMILWVQDTDTDTGEFWFKNILSGSKLRKQYDKLSANITSEMRKRDRNKSQHDKLLEVGERWLKKQKEQEMSV